MESRSNQHHIRDFFDSLLPGSRVVWIANGAKGTVQPDKSILWDDGHHMTRRQMNDSHALLIHSEAERTVLEEALARRLDCLNSGCKLIHWDPANCIKDLPERLCPFAVITESETHSSTSRHHRKPARQNLPTS